jgi:hypothetical protein
LSHHVGAQKVLDFRLGLVAGAYNLKYSSSGNLEGHSSKLPEEKSYQDPISTKKPGMVSHL